MLFGCEDRIASLPVAGAAFCPNEAGSEKARISAIAQARIGCVASIIDGNSI